MIDLDFQVLPSGEILGFSCKGHADFADAGTDIVCAAVSSAAYMAVNTVTDVLAINPVMLFAEDGRMAIRVNQKDEAICRPIFQGLKLHMIQLEEQYGNNLRVGYMEV